MRNDAQVQVRSDVLASPPLLAEKAPQRALSVQLSHFQYAAAELPTDLGNPFALRVFSLVIVIAPRYGRRAARDRSLYGVRGRVGPRKSGKDVIPR